MKPRNRLFPITALAALTSLASPGALAGEANLNTRLLIGSASL